MDGIVKYNDDHRQVVKKKEYFEAEIKRRGEEGARRAGAILDVSVDGYYNTNKCLADFEMVSLHFYIIAMVTVE